MAYLFRNKDEDGKEFGPWRFQFTTWQGTRKTFTTPYTNKKEAERLAGKMELEAKEIRRDIIPAPKTHQKAMKKPFREVADEYLEWGRSQGGRGGRPWGKGSEKNRRLQLKWWEDRLSLELLGDLVGTLPQVEGALGELQKTGLTGKTVNGYSETMIAFINWAITRGYLDANPLQDLQTFDATPTFERRDLSPAEIAALFKVAPADRRLAYAVAITSGLRARELRKLSADDLDVERGGVRLDAAWTKSRKGGFQHLPAGLVARLAEYVAEGTAERLYRKAYSRPKAKGEDLPENPLLFLSAHPDRYLKRDIEAAGISPTNPRGKVDFHSLRVTFITLAEQAGAGAKELQVLARHSDPSLTLRRYAKVWEPRLKQIVEAVGEHVWRHFPDAESTKIAVRMAAGAENSFHGNDLGEEGLRFESGHPDQTEEGWQWLG